MNIIFVGILLTILFLFLLIIVICWMKGRPYYFLWKVNHSYTRMYPFFDKRIGKTIYLKKTFSRNTYSKGVKNPDHWCDHF